MSNLALYRKYRPSDFANLVGQDHIRITLTNAIKSGHISQAYLFAGPRGTGKTSTARLIAKALNCENPKNGYEPCNECSTCKDIESGRFIDLLEIDAASNRGIDEVRDLNEKIHFAPTRGDYKVYIIDEVHMMTTPAFNALLKTLEEPPEHAYFIFATTEVHKIPETILSRCQRFDFRRITETDIKNRLKFIAKSEKIEAEEKALDAIAHYVNGGMRDAIGIFEQLISNNKVVFKEVQALLGITGKPVLEELYSYLQDKDTVKALNLITKIYDQGSDLKQFLHDFIGYLRKNMLVAVLNKKIDQVKRTIEIIDIFQSAEREIYFADIPQLPLEIAIIKVTGNLKTPNVEATEPETKAEKEAEKKIEKEEEKNDDIISDDKKDGGEMKQELEQKLDEKVEGLIKQTTEEGVGEKGEEEEKNKTPDSPTNTLNNKNDSAVSFEKIKEIWPRVIEKITIPKLKNTLKSTLPHSKAGYNLILKTNSNFNSDVVMDHAHRAIIEDIFKTLINENLKISMEVEKIELDSKSDIEPEPDREEASSVISADHIQDMFGGGEVIG